MTIEEVTEMAKEYQSEMSSFVKGMIEQRNHKVPLEKSREAARLTYLLMKIAETNIRITELQNQLIG